MKRTSVLKSLTLAFAVVVMASCGFEGKPMPADYPLPVYPGATAPNDGFRDVMGAKSQILDIKEGEDFQKIADFYKAELEKQGFEVKVDKKGDTFEINATKGGGDKDAKVEVANIKIAGKNIILTYVKT